MDDMKRLHIDQLFTGDDGSVGYARGAADFMRVWYDAATRAGQADQAALWYEAKEIWLDRAVSRSSESRRDDLAQIASVFYGSH